MAASHVIAFSRFVAVDWWLVMIGGLGCEVPGWWWFGSALVLVLKVGVGGARNASERHGIWLGRGTCAVRCSLEDALSSRHSCMCAVGGLNAAGGWGWRGSSGSISSSQAPVESRIRSSTNRHKESIVLVCNRGLERVCACFSPFPSASTRKYLVPNCLRCRITLAALHYRIPNTGIANYGTAMGHHNIHFAGDPSSDSGAWSPPTSRAK